MKILFIHDHYGSQFKALHDYLCKQSKIKSYMLCLGNQLTSHQFDKNLSENILTYAPDGDVSNSYYYSNGCEKDARSSLQILQTVRSAISTHNIDIICTHHREGHGTFLPDFIDIPIVTYFESPSHLSHGYDQNYPPYESQMKVEAFAEALSYQSVLKSDASIIPSTHGKSLFPTELQDKITVQMDAFNPESFEYNSIEKLPFEKEYGKIYVGFTARTLSSEKGYEQFVQVSKRVSELNPNIVFVVIGEKKGPSYGYEDMHIESKYGADKNFSDYLFEKYNVDPANYIFLGSLPYPEFSTCIHHLDIMLLPVLYGIATWNVFECLSRGKIVICCEESFAPEFITNAVDGYLLPYNDIDSWADLTNNIARSLEEYEHIGKNAKQRSEKYHDYNVAKRYLDIFEKTIKNYKPKKLLKMM